MDRDSIHIVICEVHDIINEFKENTSQKFEKFTKEYLAELAIYEKAAKNKSNKKKPKNEVNKLKVEANKPKVLPSILEADEVDTTQPSPADASSSSRGKRKAALKAKNVTEKLKSKSRGRKKKSRGRNNSSASKNEVTLKAIQKDQSEKASPDKVPEKEIVLTTKCEVVLTKISDEMISNCKISQSVLNELRANSNSEETSNIPSKLSRTDSNLKKNENVTSLKSKTEHVEGDIACASSFPEERVGGTAPLPTLPVSNHSSKITSNSSPDLFDSCLNVENSQAKDVPPPNTTVILKKAILHSEEIKEFKSPTGCGVSVQPTKRITRSKQRTQDKSTASLRSSSSEEDGHSRVGENFIKGAAEEKPVETPRAPEQPAKRITRSKQRTHENPAASSRSSSREGADTCKAVEDATETQSSEPLHPPIRVTRSKQRAYEKPPANSRLESDTDEPQTQDTAAGKDVQEKRITRSKRAPPKEDKEIKSSSDEVSPAKKSFLSPPNTIKCKVNIKELQSIFTPLPSSGKENCGSRKEVGGSGPRHTPLRIQNSLITPSTKPKFFNIVSSATKSKTALDDADRRRKEEEAYRKRMKEQEAAKKKIELLKAKQEEIRRKNEEKMLRRARQQAANKETKEKLQKLEKEKEERERAAKEQLDKKREQELALKKKLHEEKATEVEMRRMKEEQARLARLKEMEEEKRKEEESRQKLQEEAERIKRQHLEEIRMREAILKSREAERKKMNTPKDKDNYDISDDKPGDSDDEDDGRNHKKDIPTWARRGEEKERDTRVNSLVQKKIISQYFACPSQTPDLTDFFGNMTMKRVRTSSAVWHDTPPLKKKSMS